MIFSTMSSASIRVSSTQVGWLSTESFFRLGWGRAGTMGSVRTMVDTYQLKEPQVYVGTCPQLCSLTLTFPYLPSAGASACFTDEDAKAHRQRPHSAGAGPEALGRREPAS